MHYLEIVDALLKDGLQGLGEDFAEAQLAFVLAQQQPDGGFRGRQGASDLYYTDFALRTVTLLGGQDRLHEATVGYLDQVAVRDVLEAFCLLNCRRLLGPDASHQPLSSRVVRASRPPHNGTMEERAGRPHHADSDEGAATQDCAMRAALQLQVLESGAFSRPGSHVCSAYTTFLAGLVYEMLDETMPRRLEAAQAIAALQQPNGGFREQQGEGGEQTNSTAAAVAFLLTAEMLTERQARHAEGFLVKMQADDGGFLAHHWAAEGDLLSSFTALLTLAALDGLNRLRLGDLARFVRACAAPEGGFKASPTDQEPDVEYTYYGLGCLALLRSAAR